MATQKMELAKKKCTTPKFRASFADVWKAKSFNGQEPKFSITMLFDKTTDLKEMKRAAHNAAVEAWGSDKAKWPKKHKMPFGDGNEKSDLKGYANKIVVTARAKADNPPQIINQDKEEILEQREFYSGCYARATLIAFAYDTAGNIGISFSLQNIQKLGDGEKFSGKPDAKDEFDSVEDDSNDASQYESEDDDGYDVSA